MKKQWNGLEVTIAGTKGDLSDSDPRYHEDDKYISEVKIVDQDKLIEFLEENILQEI